jgi:hypothetical protein
MCDVPYVGWLGQSWTCPKCSTPFWPRWERENSNDISWVQERWVRKEETGTGQAHRCDTPATALPGQTWTCLVCSVRYWAESVEAETEYYMNWRVDAET